MSGGYAGRTGRDIMDLPFHLIVDVCHDTIERRLGGNAEALREWWDHLNRPPRRWVFAGLPYALATVAADNIGKALHPDHTTNDDPAGWDDNALLAQMQSGAMK